MRLLPLLGVAAVLAGCGAADDRPAATPMPSLNPNVYGPKQAAPDVRVPIPHPHALPASPVVARALAAGVVGVVDMEGHVGVRPPTLETSKDGTLEQVKWLRWGADGAAGRGELHVNTCNPSCAVGTAKTVPVTITLSDVRTCEKRRYFDAAVLQITAADNPFDGRQPVAYVRAPC
jgi:hypothetical protein